MASIFSRFFDTNTREIDKLTAIVSQINDREKVVEKLKDTDFPKETEKLKARVSKGESLESVRVEAFALVREASKRVLGMRHFDVQMMAGIVLSDGKIAEQKTGEGKTLTAVSALYLHALTGKGVHAITVNDYLARREPGWMGPIFHFLGMSTASIISEQQYLYDPSYTDETAHDYRFKHLRPVTRKEAYEANVLYGINSEFGFDYLRDNMAQSIDQINQKEYYYAIVDEVDSVLIDEARTPHIISAPDAEPSQKYYEYAELVDKLVPEVDYKIDEKQRTAHLTDHGIGKIEKLYGVENIYEKDFDTVYHLEAALKARTLYHKEKEYIVRDGQVILVDEFTGRLRPGVRVSEGIHQALEAKEHVTIQRESKTLATVSLQNYFRMYKNLAGMTGTAVTEAEEFNKIYKLDVVVIPTNNVLVRKDLSDAVYKTGRAKFTAVVDEIEKVHKTGQPVLVGTTSIDKNEIISEILKRRKIPHVVLNAKNHLQEAEIISGAGKKDAVTIATNMAGRGVDIVLGGESPKNDDGTSDKSSAEYKKWQKAHDEVVSLGGLYVIGTERHESRRIDNQLRGRAGRQGDPGVSRFFVALDDEIMRLFGGDRISGLMTRFNMPEDVPLEHPLVSKAIENAQIKVEKHYFDYRKYTVEYDDVLNKQREIIYGLRRKVLEGKDTRTEIIERLDSSIKTLVNRTVDLTAVETTSADQTIMKEFSCIIPFDEASQSNLTMQLEQLHTNPEKEEFLFGIAHQTYEMKEKQMGEELMRQAERYVMLSVIDNYWMSHLDAMENLRSGVGLRGYAQKDPLVEYKNEGYRMFEQLVFSIDDDIIHQIYKIQINAPLEEHHHEHVHQHLITNTPESEVSETQINTDKRKNTEVHKKNPRESASSLSASIRVPQKLGRNDPCPCGSGLKYKKCGLINAPEHKG
jgi:preprotein translocase subunit SecA